MYHNEVLNTRTNKQQKRVAFAPKAEIIEEKNKYKQNLEDLDALK